jgi:DNA-binding MarR family transcriptional regulator
MNTENLPNLLGAFALALGDAQLRAAREASGLGDTAASALVALGSWSGEPIGTLARIIGVTHSVAVRLVDQLAAQGLVERLAGRDRREVALRLTRSGERQRLAILKARARAINALVDAIAPRHHALLHEAVTAMLVAATTDRRTADHLCRLCDEEACGGKACPVEREACRLEALAP